MNLGIHYIYECLRLEGVHVERFFKTPIPYRSVENDTLLERFPLITGGISYEGDVVSFFEWLHAGGIELSRERRAERDAQIVGAGGALSYINPLPLCAVCDFIVLGEAVPLVPFIVRKLRDWRHHGERFRLLEELAENDSILVPAIHLEGKKLAEIAPRSVSVQRADVPLEADGSPGRSAWVTPRSVWGRPLLVELQRGCARRCPFCTLPNCFGPMRQRSVESVLNLLDRVRANASFDRVGLVTAEAGDYVHLETVLDALEHSGLSVSFASLRIDALTERMMRMLLVGGRRSFTVAPEAGSDRLRAVVGKTFTNDFVIEKLHLARSLGARQVKLYFMVDLPTETPEDVCAIAELCARVVGETGLDCVASAAPFVAKPRTPWWGRDLSSMPAIRQKYALIANKLASSKASKKIDLRLGSLKEAQLERSIAWYGPEESRVLARGVASGARVPFALPERARVREILNALGF